MEKSVKEQSATTTAVSGSCVKSLNKYPLRSASKSKVEKPAVPELPNSSSSKRGRPISSVSKSMGVLDLSSKENSVKPPRRLSIQAKSNVTPTPKVAANITPISEVRIRRSGQGKNETPVSNMSRSSAASRKNPSVISSAQSSKRIFSASYWLLQIRNSESASKHSISLGFFKLALEAGCEPFQQMRDELKAYTRRHNLSELGNAVKELFESYKISENTEQLQVSETCSQVPGDGTRSSDDEVRSTSTAETKNSTPKTSTIDNAQVSSTSKPDKKETNLKVSPPTRTRRTLNKSSANSRPVPDTGGRKPQKKIENATKPMPNNIKDRIKKNLGKKCATEEGGQVSPSPAVDNNQADKENMDMDGRSEEENSLAEVRETASVTEYPYVMPNLICM